MIKAEEAYKKVMQSLVNLSDIESKINNAIKNKRFEITLGFQETESNKKNKIYKILYYYFTALGYEVSEYCSHSGYIGIKISWDLK